MSISRLFLKNDRFVTDKTLYKKLVFYQKFVTKQKNVKFVAYVLRKTGTVLGLKKTQNKFKKRFVPKNVSAVMRKSPTVF